MMNAVEPSMPSLDMDESPTVVRPAGSAPAARVTSARTVAERPASPSSRASGSTARVAGATGTDPPLYPSQKFQKFLQKQIWILSNKQRFKTNFV